MVKTLWSRRCGQDVVVKMARLGDLHRPCELTRRRQQYEGITLNATKAGEGI